MDDDLSPGVPAGAWLSTARAMAPSRLELPGNAVLSRLLARLDVSPEDAAELPGRLAEVADDPTLSWVAARFTTALSRDIGRIGLPSPYADPARAWPTLPFDLGAAAHCVYLPGFLATVDQVREVHRAHGIPDARSWSTVADFGRRLRLHRQVWGVAGTDTQWWSMTVWSGGLVDLGRLQGEWLSADAVGLHIPPTGPLDPGRVLEALAVVRADWPRWYGATPVRVECYSWLLDPQLADWMPATSNIVQFQRMFVLDPQRHADDESPLYFVFHRRGVPQAQALRQLPRHTSLQRAIVDHLLQGGHWYSRRGWIAL
jgi:hypothetical protein